MSDDEQYAGSPYDDFEEMLWDADPGPDLADDLAQHFAHSPVWQDDPVGELEPYHSDWEYYSDDYYDDDPAILRHNPIDGSPARTKTSGRTHLQKRGRKRKHDETRQALDTKEKEVLANSIRGTVWATANPPNTKIFCQGQEKKVALLTDWKERFKLGNGALQTFGQGQLTRDESWANDLSLADMGLTLTQKMARAGNNTTHEDDGMDEGAHGSIEEVEDEDEIDNDINEQEPSISELSGPDETQGPVPLLHQRQLRPQILPTANGHGHTRATAEQQQETDIQHPRKKRRVSDLPTPPQTQESQIAATQEGFPHSVKTTKESNGVAGGNSRDTSMHQSRVRPRSQLPHSEVQEVVQKTRSRKRKVSVDSTDDTNVLESTASRRSKRVALAGLRSGQNSDVVNEVPAPKTRHVRGQKK